MSRMNRMARPGKNVPGVPDQSIPGARNRQSGCLDKNCHHDREGKMVAVGGNAFCDPCIAPIVSALNAAGIRTVASCCGHGFRPGWIALIGGRSLILARSQEETAAIQRMFPVDINGDRMEGQG